MIHVTKQFHITGDSQDMLLLVVF